MFHIFLALIFLIKLSCKSTQAQVFLKVFQQNKVLYHNTTAGRLPSLDLKALRQSLWCSDLSPGAAKNLLRGGGLNQTSNKNVSYSRRAEQTVATQVGYITKGVWRRSPQPLGNFCDFSEKLPILTLFGSLFPCF